MNIVWRLLGVALTLFFFIVLIKYTALGSYLSFEYIKLRAIACKDIIDKDFFVSALVYFGLVALVTALSIPILIFVVLIGGFLFGAVFGACIAALGSATGSIVSFLFFRYVLGSYIQVKYQHRLAKFNEKMHQFGAWYLLILHFLAIVPFFIISMFAAVSPISLKTFVLTSFLGSLPVYFVYALAGRELGTISSMKDLFSPMTLLSLGLLILLATMPLAIKKLKSSVQM